MTETPAPKKGKPTPARKQQEAARKKPLVAPRTKEGKKLASEKLRAERLQAREGFASGNQKYLPKRDAGPQRKLIRDVVDSRWFTVGEALLPVMIISILVPPGNTETLPLATAINVVVLSIFGLYVADTVLITRSARARLIQKFGADNIEKGVWLYVAFRAMYPRIIRLPKAQVPRGNKL